MHICISKLIIIGSDNGLSPSRRQVIIWTSEGMLLIWQFDTKFNELLMEMDVFSFERMQLNMASAKMAAILFRHQCAHLVMSHPQKKTR